MVQLKQRRTFSVLGLAGCTRVGENAGDEFFQFVARGKHRDGVVVAFAHLAAIQTGQGGHLLIHRRFWQYKKLVPVNVVEALTKRARHFDVLHLIAAHRHLVRIEDQDVGGHQHRVHEQPGADAGIVVLTLGAVFIHRRFVGMRTIENALAGHAGEQPRQLGDFWNVRLPIEPHLGRIQPAGQPRRRNLQRGTLRARGVLRLDQAVIVRKEIKTLGIGRTCGGNRWTDGADIVAKVGCAGGGDAGQDAGLAHAGLRLSCEINRHSKGTDLKTSG